MGYEEDVIAAEQEAIKIKSRSKAEKERRYDRRQWARSGQEAKEEFEHRYDPEPEPQRKPVKVTRQEPERVEPKSVKIQRKGMDESKARYAQRQADRIMREAKDAGKQATKTLAEKLVRKQEKVDDEAVVEKVDRALKSQKIPKSPVVKTRSQELREIRDKSYEKQRGIEEKKTIQKENKAAERSGRRAGMGFVDRNVDRVVEAREKVESVGERIDEVREAVRPGSTKAKPKSKATVKPVKLTAAQKRRLEQQMARSQKAISPKSRTPFGMSKKSLSGPTTQKSSGSLNKPRGGSLNAPQKPSFGSIKSGNPFAQPRKGNPFGSVKSGNPLGSQRHTGNPFGATSRMNANPIGWSPKRITRL